ncbi:MAG: lytic transglycosylase domain-containing protein [Gammaproteobacteria bacterium]|nr:lytic transglycosylase domain-containing protein [Gammaproteobacteria bacterium]
MSHMHHVHALLTAVVLLLAHAAANCAEETPLSSGGGVALISRLGSNVSDYFQKVTDNIRAALKYGQKSEPGLKQDTPESESHANPVSEVFRLKQAAQKPGKREEQEKKEKQASQQTAVVIPMRSLFKLADKAADKHGIDPALFRALVQQESSWRIAVVSKAGAAGLTQITAGAAQDCGISDEERFDPAKNLNCGAWYLAIQKKRFGSYKLALAAYNSGPARVEKQQDVPDIGETQRYVKKVLAAWKGEAADNETMKHTEEK